MPPSQFSLEQLVNKGAAAAGIPIGAAARLLGRQQPAYNYAESRLSRKPVLIVQDPSQAKGGVLGEKDYGGYLQTVDPWNTSPMSNVVRKNVVEGKSPVVIAPYEPPSYGPAGSTGTEHGVMRHESVHQYLGDTKVPLGRLFASNPALRQTIESNLDKMNYTDKQYADEVASRLAAGQFQSLGLTPQQGVQVWKQWLSELSKTDPKKAARLDMYTRASHAAILKSGEPTSEQASQWYPTSQTTPAATSAK
jgi:hypothetical protein